MKKFYLLFLLLYSSVTYAKTSIQDFNFLIKSISAIFASEVADLSATLTFTLKQDPTGKPNAYASKRENNIWEVTIISTLLELDQISTSSLAMILCHEIGHFIGGKPYVIGRRLTPAVVQRAPKNMSAEGQADFFAAQICFPALINEYPEIINQVNFYPVNQIAVKDCQNEICKKSIHTSYETILVYQELMKQLGAHESFFGHLKNETSDRTLNFVSEYPTLDCRFETFVNAITGAEMRPSCWFVD